MNPYVFWPIWGLSLFAVFVFPIIGFWSGVLMALGALIFVTLFLQVHCVQARDDATRAITELQQLRDGPP